MIIKSMTRKGSPSFGQLLGYIRGSVSQEHPVILHNLKTSEDDLKKIEGEFLRNFQHCPKRKNGIVLFHEILSFSVLDKSKVTPEIMEDLTREYLNLRGPNALGYAQAHFEKDAVHVHIMLSGNLISSAKKLRLSRKAFDRIKRELEKIQRERYPELTNSLVFEGDGKTVERRRQGRKEAERERRTRKSGREKEQSRKDQIVDSVRRTLRSASSRQEFEKRMKAHQLTFYIRGKTPGIKDECTGRKYRLKTLGLMVDYEKAQKIWEKMPKREKALQTLDWKKVRRDLAELGFKKDILEVLNIGIDENDPEHIKKRKKELRRVARLQRELRRQVLDRQQRRNIAR